MLSFLRIRAIVNGRQIYPLPDGTPVEIELEENNSRLVISDGYHITRPLKLVYKLHDTYHFHVGCAVSDTELLMGFLFLSGFYLVGFFSGIFALKLLSFLPIIWVVLFYYLNRRDFIQLTPVIKN